MLGRFLTGAVQIMHPVRGSDGNSTSSSASDSDSESDFDSNGDSDGACESDPAMKGFSHPERSGVL